MKTNTLRKFEKITVFHQGALGDFILACSVFESLSGLAESGRLFFWTRRQHAELIESEPFFGGFFPHDDPSILAFFDDALWMKASIPKPCYGADLVIFFGKQSIRIVADRLNKRIGETGGICLWVPSFPEGDETNIPVPLFVAENLNKKLSCPLSIRPFKINPPEKALAQARDMLGNIQNPICIHPGSGGIRKIWPLARWMGLVEWLKTTFPAESIVVITGPADNAVEPFVKWAEERHGVLRLQNVSLLILSAALSMGRLYIGNDSGISHLATACGVPALVIFGPTNPAVWAPWGENAIVLKRQWKEEDILAFPAKISADFYDDNFPDQEIRNKICEIVSRKTS
ncbi:MAG: glycosyltransferase family 9 protein [Thermodesulforhabdaceae bacterium]